MRAIETPMLAKRIARIMPGSSLSSGSTALALIDPPGAAAGAGEATGAGVSTDTVCIAGEPASLSSVSQEGDSDMVDLDLVLKLASCTHSHGVPNAR